MNFWLVNYDGVEIPLLISEEGGVDSWSFNFFLFAMLLFFLGYFDNKGIDWPCNPKETTNMNQILMLAQTLCLGF